MRSIVFFFIVLLSTNVYAQQYSSFDELIGKELLIKTNWTGISLTLERKSNKLTVCHTVFGSGVYVISKTSYPVSKVSERQIRFSLNKLGESKEKDFILNLSKDGELSIYYQGYRLASHTVANINSSASSLTGENSCN